MRAQPHTASAVHHHGSQDTIVYAVSGHGSLVTSSNDSDGDTRHDLKPGDWALIPAYREHQEVNDGEDEAVWVSGRPLFPSRPFSLLFSSLFFFLGGWGESHLQHSDFTGSTCRALARKRERWSRLGPKTRERQEWGFRAKA